MREHSRFALRYSTIIFRHGDRSPTFNCMEPHVQASAKEAAAWAKMLPMNSFQNNLHKAWPIKSKHKSTRDEQLGIFGSLTQMGVYQMFRLGRVVAASCTGRCFRHGLLKPHKPSGNEIRIHSSNYKRTQLSAQSFLLGLFPKHRNLSDYPKSITPIYVLVSDEGDDFLNVYATSTELKLLLKEMIQNNYEIATAEQSPQVMLTKDAIMSTIPAFHYFIRPFTWTSVVDHFHCRSARASARYCFFKKTSRTHNPILTPGMKAFLMDEEDMDPHGRLAAFTDVSKVRELFREYDSSGESVLKKGDVARLLQEVLGVVSPTDEDAGVFFKALDSDNDNANAIGIDELVSFMVESETEHDYYDDGFYAEGRKMDNWHAHATLSERALGWRFDYWLNNPEVRRLVFSGVAERILNSMLMCINEFQINEARKSAPCLEVFSSHDATILPLLFALGSWSCKLPSKEESNPISSKWPGYASAVLFELYQDLEVKGDILDSFHGWYIKIFFHEGVVTGQKYLDDPFESVSDDEWSCPPSSVHFKNIALDQSATNSMRDNSANGKGEILVPMKDFIPWIQAMI